jgi:molecular chaperone Hsp33
MGYMIRGVDKELTFRFFAVDARDTVEQARQFHATSPLASAALGRTLTAGLMMGYTLKNKEDRITIKINGKGPLGTILVTADNIGHVKGYIDHPEVVLPLREDGKLDVGLAVGREGAVQVIKDNGLKKPYSSSSKLVTGEIGEDIASYFFYSEQQPTVVGLGVLVDVDYSIKSAGGFMLQLMPYLSEDEIIKIEKAIAKIPSVSSRFEQDKDIELIVQELLPDFELLISEKIPVSYQCDCSRDRMKEILTSLGEKELGDIIYTDKKAEIQCHFCNKKYLFLQDELQAIIKQSHKTIN